MARLEGKTCLITGASRGIGLEFVRQLLAKGNTVVAAVRTQTTPLQALQAAHAGKLLITSLDVSDPTSIDAWAKDLAASKLGHLDFVLNNAGIYGERIAFGQATAEEMEAVFRTNAAGIHERGPTVPKFLGPGAPSSEGRQPFLQVGPLLVAQALKTAGLIGPPGSLLANMTSKMGSVDDNTSGGSYGYRASKAALNMISKSMSIDLAPDGITCVLLHPGYVRTDMTGGAGLINTDECVRGLLAVLEGKQALQGRWFDFKGQEIPW